MSAPRYASLNAGLLARKGEAKPSQVPSFGSRPWQPPVVPVVTAAPPAWSQIAPQPPAAASMPGIAQEKVRLQDVAAAWPQAKLSQTVDLDGPNWVAAKARDPQLGNHPQPIKTTIRLTHAQVRAVKLAALVLDKPQQEILTAGLLGRLEALACTDLSSCSCFKAVLEGLKMPEPLEPPLAY